MVSSEQLLRTRLESRYRNRSPFRTLWHLYAGHRGALALAVLFFVIKHSPVWVFPWFTAGIIYHVEHRTADSAEWITVYAVVMGVLVLQNPVTHTVYTYFFSKANRSMQLSLRHALIVRLQHLSMSFHDEFAAGRLQSKVLRDVEAVENLSRQLVQNLLSGLIAVTFALSVAFSKDPRVALFFVGTVPLAVGLMHVFRKRMAARNSAFRQEVEAMSAQVAEMIEMIPVTRAHAAEQTEVEKLHRQLLAIRKRGQALDVNNEFFASSAWSTFQAFSLGCLLFTVYLCFQAKLTIADITLYQMFFAMIVGAVSGFLMVYPQVATGVESIRSIGEVLECPDLELNDGKRVVERVAGRITFQEVGYAYPGAARPAVAGFSLEVSAGECVAFVGESGSGKSTLMNLVIGFRRPTSGRILLDGVDMAELNMRSYRRHIAVVPQQTVLFSGTIRENITYGLRDVGEEAVRRVVEMANVAEFVAKLPEGLETRIGPHGGKLSGGQRQRIAIARALLRDPRVIILDEATSALDVVSERLVQEAIGRLIKGRTTLIVAHRLSTIRNADRIVVMGDGRMVEMGTPAELMELEMGAFRRLRELQV